MYLCSVRTALCTIRILVCMFNTEPLSYVCSTPSLSHTTFNFSQYGDGKCLHIAGYEFFHPAGTFPTATRTTIIGG